MTRRFKYDGYWRKVRRRVMLRDRGLCQIKGSHCTVFATQVDHVVPVLAGGALYDETNLRASCEWCNKSRADQSRKRRAGQPSREW